MRRSLLLFSLCLVLLTLAGCGNKGPLVLPPPKPTPVVAQPTAPAAASSTAPAASAERH
ncbi:LPS translocon maturation chaperone LptM [Dyella tabacisoli]|uniref:Sugar transporter n=1 Tax=Dyella tabacisoli TaxID=2282381 RepID=A0A369URF2_9GAMM|nr:lipoprotein [Dyella tabacisoli]RDD80899.1 sugar transporter [Dyella tabacisoli]